VGITSGGHTWSLNVSLIGGSSGGPVIVDVLIETPHLSGTEIHDWGMQMPGADFTVNKTTGAATVNSLSDLSPVASLNLSYKPASHTAGTCSSGSETDYLGTLAGSVTLTTGAQAQRREGHVQHAELASGRRRLRAAARVQFRLVGRRARRRADRAHRGRDRRGHARAPGALHRCDQEGVPPGPGRGNPHRRRGCQDHGAGVQRHGENADGQGPRVRRGHRHWPHLQGQAGDSRHRDLHPGRHDLHPDLHSYNGASWSSSKQFEAQTILTGTLKAATTGSGEFVNITLKK
jgi:hypothetical protein